jgi:hypothetical protein
MVYKVFTNIHPKLDGFQTSYSVIDYYESDRVSGGPTVAIFYNELMAKEYTEFKNKQKEKMIK